jgi:hypothetical protein
MRYNCAYDKEEFEYSPETYGGYLPAQGYNLCPKHHTEYIEMINKHNKEIRDWWASAKDTRGTV